MRGATAKSEMSARRPSADSVCLLIRSRRPRPWPSGLGSRRLLSFLVAVGIAIPTLERPTKADVDALHRARTGLDVARAGCAHCQPPDIGAGLERGWGHDRAHQVASTNPPDDAGGLGHL